MKKIVTFFFLGVLLVMSGSVAAQETKSNDNGFNAQVKRSAEGTYIELSWPAASEKAVYNITLYNLEGKTSQSYQTSLTGIKIFAIDEPATYEWTVIPEGIEYDRLVFGQPRQFKTGYFDGGIRVSTELFQVIDGWKGKDFHNSTLEDYIRNNARGKVSAEEIEKFIQEFYNGNPPSKRVTTRNEDDNNDSDCLCELVTAYSSANNPADPGTPIIDTLACNGCNANDPLWCNHWDRNVERYATGIAKDLFINFSGRLSESNRRSYSLDTLIRTSDLYVELVCETNDCCGTEVDYNLFYGSKLDLTGDYESKGNMHIQGYDMASAFLIHDENEVEILGEPMILGAYYSDSTQVLYNWEDAIEDAFGIITSILPDTVFATVSQDTSGLSVTLDSFDLTIVADTILGNAQNILVGVFNILTGNNFIRLIDEEGGNLETNEKTWFGTLMLEPNQSKRFLLRSVSNLEYKEVWGKKDVCPFGEFWLNASLQSAYSYAFLMDKGGEDPDPTYDLFCCFNDFAEYYTHSFIDETPSGVEQENGIADHTLESMLSIAAAFIGRQAVTFQGPWTDLFTGEEITANTGGILLTDQQKSLFRENDCCQGPDFNHGLNIEIECVEGGIIVVEEEEPVLSRFVPGPTGPSYSCNKVKGTVQILDCPSESDHIIEFFAIDLSTQTPYFLFMIPVETGLCEYEFEFNVYAGMSYFVRQRINNGCRTKTVSTPINIPDSGRSDGEPGLNHQPTLKPDIERIRTANHNVHLYPNPTSGDFTLEFSGLAKKGNVQFDLLNLQGQKLKSFLLPADLPVHQLSVSGLAPGMYLGIIQDGVHPPISTTIVIK